MKSYIPCSLSSRKLNARGTTAALMKHCLLWQWLHEVLAPGYSLWDHLGKLCKNTTWRLAWRWKKSDDCPLSETLKAPHFYRRRNHIFLFFHRFSRWCSSFFWLLLSILSWVSSIVSMGFSFIDVFHSRFCPFFHGFNLSDFFFKIQTCTFLSTLHSACIFIFCTLSILRYSKP